MERLSPSPLQAVQDTFDTWAREGQGERMARGHWPTSRQVLDTLNLQPGHRVLDLGCGNGYLAAEAQARVTPTGSATGIDLSPEMVQQAQATFGATGARFQVANVMALPFADNAFEAITCIESLYYYPDIPGALAEIYRVLAPGGRFGAMADFYRENPYCAPWAELMPVHLTLLGEAEYRQTLEAAGFTAISTQRLLNPEPVDAARFQPGWGYTSVEDVVDFRQRVGSLGIFGQKPT